jgi:hypothetical protein
MIGPNQGDGRHFPSQLIFGARRLDIPYEEWVSNWAEAQQYVGQPHFEVTKKDYDSYNIRAFGDVDLSGFWLAYAGIERRMRLPDVLTSIELTYEKGGGGTTYTEVGTSTASGDYSVGMSLAGSAQASAFVIPKLIPQVTETWSFNPPVMHYFYYGHLFDQTTILALLTEKLGVPVLAWPIFKPESLIFKLVGSKVNASGRATAQGSAAAHSSGTAATGSIGFGEGRDYAPVIETMTIPPTLHDAITLSPGSDTESHTGETSIGATGVVILASTGTATADAAGSVTPTSISATSPTALPSSGLYLFDFDVQPDAEMANSGANWYFAHAVIFDFSVL